MDGKATEAVLAAVADAFGVRRGSVRLVSGAASRTKVIDIDAGDPQVFAALRPPADVPSGTPDPPRRRATGRGPGKLRRLRRPSGHF